ncbi:uncharacterized protein L3040_006551 [Drepanopeziza brunnea f. sp. 'multigermtubi']|uniref:uncharacterized protein n=1 Tax=Drepanopeziza brunnea f. sp. 'multigermtubi' TaxID=698441 RepID=UPI00239129F8|nr:hypothetical protein L3040_006551 [Drepanopeziza brunnea f. sp. 'multigermtubi']
MQEICGRSCRHFDNFATNPPPLTTHDSHPYTPTVFRESRPLLQRAIPSIVQMSNLQTAGDIPLQITSENSSSERRITPSWTVGQLKAKLEPVTGIPPLSQKLTLRLGGRQPILLEAADEEHTQLGNWPLAPYAEIHVTDIRPPGMRPNYTDASMVAKYEMSPDEYEQKTDSVLAWKKANKLGRFDPSAPSLEQAKLQAIDAEIKNRGIEVGKRCRVGEDDSKRGEVMYVGDVEEIPGGPGKWIGVRLDEPVGKNDGSLKGKRYWGKDGDPKFGVFVRPERVEVGAFPMIDDLEDMDEI